MTSAGGAAKRGDAPYGRVRSALAVVAAALLLLVAGGLTDAGADDPPPTTRPADEQPSTTRGPADPDPGEPTSTIRGGVTTTSVPGVTTTTIGPGAFGPPRTDPDAPPEPPMPDPSPEVRILLGQLLDQSHEELIVHETEVVVENKVDVDRYVNAEQVARATLDQNRAALARAEDRIVAAEDDLRADAIAQYMNPGTTGIELMIDTEDTSGRTRALLIEVNLSLHLQERKDAIAQRDRLRRTVKENRAALDRATEATMKARGRATRARERARKAAEKVEFEKALIEIANDRIQTERVAARQAVIGGPETNWSLPIAGQSVFTAEELADWFIQRGFPSRAQAPITDLARYYVEEGNDQGIRGDMAFAQSILETGSFTNRDTIGLNNFAGIGHCDTCASGFTFATPHLGVRAQIQLLADYTERGVELAHPIVDRRLHGPSGCCQTWWQLTHTWATAGNYGPKIMGIYREMLHWLVLERGMTPLVSAR